MNQTNQLNQVHLKLERRLIVQLQATLALIEQ